MKKADKIMSGFFREIEKWKGMKWVISGEDMQLTFFLYQFSSADMAFVGHKYGICHRQKGCFFALKMALSGHGRKGQRQSPLIINGLQITKKARHFDQLFC